MYHLDHIKATMLLFEIGSYDSIHLQITSSRFAREVSHLVCEREIISRPAAELVEQWRPSW